VLVDGIGHLPHLTRGEFVAERLSCFIDDEPARAPIAAGTRVPAPSSARRSMPSPASTAEASI
jgi:hypothetical protein